MTAPLSAVASETLPAANRALSKEAGQRATLPPWADNAAGRAIVGRLLSAEPVEGLDLSSRDGTVGRYYGSPHARRLARLYDDALRAAIDADGASDADQFGDNVLALLGQEKPGQLVQRLYAERDK